MKHTQLMKMLAVGAVSALALGTSFGQVTKETTTTTGAGGVSATTTTHAHDAGVSSTSSTTTSLDGTGMITTYTPGQEYMEFRTSTSSAPTKYYYTKKTTVVDSTGAVVDMSLLRPDLPVSYSYVKEGDRMVVSKITVQKPLAEIKKVTETTTTTTTTDH
ncbi:MAG: hypothetical protein ABIR71_03050 [Chthoniobacterales bacterium]